MTDYASRQDRLRAALAASNVDLLFVPPSANLEYLAGVRRSANWGRVLYSHAWLCGGYFPQEGAPVFLFPRMFAEFDLKGMLPPNTVVVAESDDPVAALQPRP